VDIGNSMSDSENFERRLQQKRICDLGLTLALEENPLTILDQKLLDALSLEPLLASDDDKSRYLEMLYSFATVYIDNGRYASTEKVLSAAKSFDSRIGEVESPRYKLAMENLKSSEDAAAMTEATLRKTISLIVREKDARKRESMLDDAWADVLLKKDDFNFGQYETELSRLWIAPQLADLKSRASALNVSPFTQINWRQQLIDRAVFQFLDGAVGTQPKDAEERRKLIDEAIQIVQLRANDRADSALLRSALRSLLETPLKDAAKGLDDAYVLWRRENDELIEKVAHGDLIVDDNAIKVQSRDRSIEFNKTLASAAPDYQRVVGLGNYTSASFSKALADE
jgi:hypothetical protein